MERTPATESSSAKGKDADFSATPVSILIVDDHPENVVALRAILGAPEEYRLVAAHSGAEALKLLLREDFALVLLDVRMPVMDGFEVAALMRRRDRTRSIPILFLTGEALDTGSVLRGYTAGAVDYIMKPLDPVVVRAKVAVFAELYRQREQIRRQAEQLMQAERKAHDLTLAELRLENELREKSMLQEALRVRDEFLALASHELKTPLTPMLGHLQMLLRAARDEKLSSERAARGLESAIQQIHKLARLIDQLLDVARIKGGRLGLSPEELDLAEVTREVIARYADEAAKVGCEIRLSCPQQPVIGTWDRMRIEQVVTNLVTNAMKFGAGKPIDVEVSTIPGDGDGESTKAGWARLVVRDQGIGIPVADTQRIFERFERAVNLQHYGGLGLGLYIVRQIIDAHGGTIHVDSRPGAGATFKVELPRPHPSEEG